MTHLVFFSNHSALGASYWLHSSECLWHDSCMLCSAWGFLVIQYFVYLSLPKEKGYGAWLSLEHVELGNPMYTTYLVLCMFIQKRLIVFLLTLNHLKSMMGFAIVAYLLLIFLIFTTDLETLWNAYGSLLAFLICWSSFLSICRFIPLALNTHMLRQGSLLWLMALLWETSMVKK